MGKGYFPTGAHHKSLPDVILGISVEFIVIVVGDLIGARALKIVGVVEHMRPGIRDRIECLTQRVPVTHPFVQTGDQAVVVRMPGVLAT